MSERRQQQEQPSVVVPDELKPGIYANELVITGAPDELILDFVRVLPSDRDNNEPPTVVARIIVPPSSFTRIQELLRRMRVELAISKVDEDEAERESELTEVESQ